MVLGGARPGAIHQASDGFEHSGAPGFESDDSSASGFGFRPELGFGFEVLPHREMPRLPGQSAEAEWIRTQPRQAGHCELHKPKMQCFNFHFEAEDNSESNGQPTRKTSRTGQSLRCILGTAAATTCSRRGPALLGAWGSMPWLRSPWQPAASPFGKKGSKVQLSPKMTFVPTACDARKHDINQ